MYELEIFKCPKSGKDHYKIIGMKKEVNIFYICFFTEEFDSITQLTELIQACLDRNIVEGTENSLRVNLLN